MSYASLENIQVSYDGRTKVLEGLSLDIERGELVSLLGSSGCGKTTTLRVVAGFIEPMGGAFRLNGKDLTRTPVHRRNFGLVFQSYALFPHLTVFDNVAFGLRLRKLSSGDIRKRVEAMLEITDLSAFAGRYPKQMSGGQRQRVALARALVIEPELLLLDEPLSNLDAKLRLGMRVEIKRLQKRLGITTIFVTHDQEECFSISDRVAIMNKGAIEQFDLPEAIYSHPVNEFVARFVGFTNFFDLAKVGPGRFRDSHGGEIEVGVDPGAESCVGAIRPEDIELSGSSAERRNVVPGIVEVRTFLGQSYQYELSTNLGRLVANAPKEQAFEPGTRVFARFPSERIVLC
jgi:putative spermidine/putrescine transport system ATP-binding protein